MRYESRKEVEAIGTAGAYFEDYGNFILARALSAFWLCLDPEDEGLTPHFTEKSEGYWESWITLG